MSSDQMVDYLFLNGKVERKQTTIFIKMTGSRSVNRRYYRALFLTICIMCSIKKLMGRATVPLPKEVYGNVKFCT